MFLAYAQSVQSFRHIIDSKSKPNAVTALENLPQDQGCSLAYAADMLRMLSDGLASNDRVDRHEGRVEGVQWDDTVRIIDEGCSFVTDSRANLELSLITAPQNL